MVDGLETLLHNLSERRERWVSWKSGVTSCSKNERAELSGISPSGFDMGERSDKRGKRPAPLCRRIGKSCGSTGRLLGTNPRMREEKRLNGLVEEAEAALKASAKPSMPPNSTLLG